MKLHSLRFALLVPLTVLAALALFLSACGDDDDTADVGDLGPDPATVAPADAPFYGEAVVRPDGEMLENFNATIGNFTGGEDPGAMITAALDEELADDELSYSENIEPWLGARVGGFITAYDPETEEADGAVAIAVTDTDAAQTFIDDAAASGDATLEDSSYNDVDYKLGDGAAIGIDGDFMIIGTEQGFKDAVDAADGDSLADNSDASASRDEIPEDALFSAYVDTQAAIDLIVASGQLTGPQLEQFEEQIGQYSEGPIEFWSTVGDDTISFAGSAPAQTDAAEPSELVSTFPADSWLAFAAPDVGAQLQTALDQFQQGLQAGIDSASAEGFDVPTPDPLGEFEDATGLDARTDFAWIGDVGGFAQGSSLLGLGGGIVIEASDEAAASDTVSKLQGALEKQRELQISPTDGGFDVTVPGAPVGAQVAVADGKLVLAAGAATVDDVLNPSDTLDGSDRFSAARDALGDDVVPSVYVDFLPILQLVESTGQTTDPDYAMAKPYLDALDYLVAGSKLDGDRMTGSLVLGLREAGESPETASAALTP